MVGVRSCKLARRWCAGAAPRRPQRRARAGVAPTPLHPQGQPRPLGRGFAWSRKPLASIDSSGFVPSAWLANGRSGPGSHGGAFAVGQGSRQDAIPLGLPADQQTVYPCAQPSLWCLCVVSSSSELSTSRIPSPSATWPRRVAPRGQVRLGMRPSGWARPRGPQVYTDRATSGR